MVSLPVPPIIESAPLPPSITDPTGAADPLMVSLPSPPCTPAWPVKVIWSLPAPLLMKSVPAPEEMVSSPDPVVMLSLPAPFQVVTVF